MVKQNRHQPPLVLAYGGIVILVCLVVFMNMVGKYGSMQSVESSSTISKWKKMQAINYTALFSSAMATSHIDIAEVTSIIADTVTNITIVEDFLAPLSRQNASERGRAGGTQNQSDSSLLVAHQNASDIFGAAGRNRADNEELKSITDMRTTTNKKIDTSTKQALFEQAVVDTTQILYKNSLDLDKWLAVPLPKVYFYDTLPKNWSDVPTISRCVNEKWLRESNPEGGIRYINWTNCLWEPEVCDDIKAPRLNMRQEQKFMNYKANYNNDVAFIQWFDGYPRKTTNASEADLFFVPYPHWSHCICNRDLTSGSAKCRFGVDEIEENVLKHLAHYEDYKERHLFLFGADWGLVRKSVRDHFDKSMTISLGPTDACKGKANELCSHYVTPYLSSGAAYQPETVSRLGDEWWTIRNRTYSVGAAFGTPQHFHLRVELMKNQSIHFGNSVGGLPLDLVDLGQDRIQIPSSRIMEIYNQSIFCPILPGDGCPQKRFFDVILSGCIPIVPIFTPSDEEGYPTFYQWSDRCSIRRTYPFSKGYFFEDQNAGIDYMSIVVTFDGFCGIKCMKSAMEEVMGNATELKRLRTTMKEYVGLFTFGLDENMYKSVDAFTAMLVTLRHYLFKLDEKIS
mmetsp:Transcript_12544/g.20888  ORF Transcript_12544/g.20888 Transcript_12544/m.20888 type:complete len:625 (+) Transcript_12544:44-1918(+)